tara:strand:+ start:664 stop:918 length:255 start_codon:yes stop_codon:yes gene_type:complete
MQTLELSGNIVLEVKNQKVPVNFYDNVVELRIDNHKILIELFKVLNAVRKTNIDILKFKKLLKIKIKSKNALINLYGKIISIIL